jgi:hypothetical protein
LLTSAQWSLRPSEESTKGRPARPATGPGPATSSALSPRGRFLPAAGPARASIALLMCTTRFSPGTDGFLLLRCLVVLGAAILSFGPGGPSPSRECSPAYSWCLSPQSLYHVMKWPGWGGSPVHGLTQSTLHVPGGNPQIRCLGQSFPGMIWERDRESLEGGVG